MSVYHFEKNNKKTNYDSVKPLPHKRITSINLKNPAKYSFWWNEGWLDFFYEQNIRQYVGIVMACHKK